MKRRDLLKVGAAAGAGTAATGGCAVTQRMEAASERGAADAFLAMLDQKLPVIDRSRFASDFVTAHRGGPPPESARAKLDEGDAMMRRMLRAMFISQSFRELPESAQLEPAVQERMMAHVDEIGATVFEVSDMLAALDVDARDRVQATLRDRPDLPMAVAEALSEQAGVAGVSRARRLQIRSMLAHTSFRMKHGDPGVVIDEYTAKVERVRAQGENDAMALALAQQVGERAFWRYQRQIAGTSPMSQQGPGMTAPTGPPRTIPEPPRRPQPGVRGMRTGAYMMGIGVVVFGLSLLLIEVSFGFVIGATVGAVLFGIGLIVLLVSLLIYAAN